MELDILSTFMRSDGTASVWSASEYADEEVDRKELKRSEKVQWLKIQLNQKVDLLAAKENEIRQLKREVEAAKKELNVWFTCRAMNITHFLCIFILCSGYFPGGGQKIRKAKSSKKVEPKRGKDEDYD